jgi:hypothetical protein
MLRTVLFSLLAILLSGCTIWLEAEPLHPVRPAPLPRPIIPGETVTYTCIGGTLVVQYLRHDRVRVFYDGAFHTLRLIDTVPKLVFTDSIYTWERGRFGRLLVWDEVVLHRCRI